MSEPVLLQTNPAWRCSIFQAETCPEAEMIPVLLEWPLAMWGAMPSIGDRYALEVYEVKTLEGGNVQAKMRPVKL